MGTLRHWRRQAVFPKVRGFRRLRRPGSIGHVLCTDRWVPPTERAGSEGSYKCGLSAAPPLVASPPPSLRRRWDNKAPRSCNLISCSKQSTGCCALRTAGERWCRKAPKGEKPPEVADSPPCQRDIRMGRETRNADFISIARRAIHHPLNPLNLLNPLNPFPAPPSTQPAAERRPQPTGPKAPSTLTPVKACSCRMAVPAAIWYNNTSALSSALYNYIV